MYRCNTTGKEFEQPRYEPNFWSKGDVAWVCLCCGETDFEELFECDLCRARATWSECGITDGHDSWRLCPVCRRIAIINLFEKGAQELGDTEEAWLDDVLDGNSWADLKKIYKEAKEHGTVTL